jgi:hypothetical protein
LFAADFLLTNPAGAAAFVHGIPQLAAARRQLHVIIRQSPFRSNTRDRA